MPSCSLLDGTIAGFASEVGRDDFHTAIVKHKLFADADASGPERLHLANLITQACQNYDSLRRNGQCHSNGVVMETPEADALHSLVEEIVGYWHDGQMNAIDVSYRLLRPGGIFAVADPNGFSSTFNRQHILRDWSLAVSHFGEWSSNWLEDGPRRIYSRSGMAPGQSAGLVRSGETDTASSIGVSSGPGVAVLLKMCSTPWQADPRGDALVDRPGRELKALEIIDQHLGYILIGRKPG